eukprot:gene7789-5443_t
MDSDLSSPSSTIHSSIPLSSCTLDSRELDNLCSPVAFPYASLSSAPPARHRRNTFTRSTSAYILAYDSFPRSYVRLPIHRYMNAAPLYYKISGPFVQHYMNIWTLSPLRAVLLYLLAISGIEQNPGPPRRSIAEPTTAHDSPRDWRAPGCTDIVLEARNTGTLALIEKIFYRLGTLPNPTLPPAPASLTEVLHQQFSGPITLSHFQMLVDENSHDSIADVLSPDLGREETPETSRPSINFSPALELFTRRYMAHLHQHVRNCYHVKANLYTHILECAEATSLIGTTFCPIGGCKEMFYSPRDAACHVLQIHLRAASQLYIQYRPASFCNTEDAQATWDHLLRHGRRQGQSSLPPSSSVPRSPKRAPFPQRRHPSPKDRRSPVPQRSKRVTFNHTPPRPISPEHPLSSPPLDHLLRQLQNIVAGAKPSNQRSAPPPSAAPVTRPVPHRRTTQGDDPWPMEPPATIPPGSSSTLGSGLQHSGLHSDAQSPPRLRHNHTRGVATLTPFLGVIPGGSLARLPQIHPWLLTLTFRYAASAQLYLLRTIAGPPASTTTSKILSDLVERSRFTLKWNQAASSPASPSQPAQASRHFAQILLAVDFTDAFCRVTPQQIYAGLSRKHVPDYINRWILSYLADRQIYVWACGRTSPTASTAVGCPQGSILGLFLWLLVMDDLLSTLDTFRDLATLPYHNAPQPNDPELILSLRRACTQLRLDGSPPPSWTPPLPAKKILLGPLIDFGAYADDLSVWITAPTPQLAAAATQLVLTVISDWSLCHGIQISTNTEARWISQSKRTTAPHPGYPTMPLRFMLVAPTFILLPPPDRASSAIRLLGLYIDPTLTFTTQIRHLITTVSSRIHTPRLLPQRCRSPGSPDLLRPLRQQTVADGEQTRLATFQTQVTGSTSPFPLRTIRTWRTTQLLQLTLITGACRLLPGWRNQHPERCPWCSQLLGRRTLSCSRPEVSFVVSHIGSCPTFPEAKAFKLPRLFSLHPVFELQIFWLDDAFIFCENVNASEVSLQ